MTWFDGTFEWAEDKLEKEFPVVISQDLRINAERTRITIINNFDEDSKLMDLADPKADEDADVVFYHTFLDEIPHVKKLIENFIASGAYENPESVILLRKDSEELFMYSFGHICISRVNNQEKLHDLLPDDWKARDTFILPLKRYMYKCPVCGQRTLQYRAYYDICPECGWEDDGFDEDDEPCFGGPNGDYTIKEYREEYLKLKAENPDYTWREAAL